MARHFLSLLDFSPEELQAIIQRAITLKQQRHTTGNAFPSRILGMIFEKSSTRTRFAFESAMAQLGGHAIFLSPTDSQLGRGEPIADTARVLSRMADIIAIRTNSHQTLETFAAHARVPVINALSDFNHPCQILADVQTYIEHRGAIQGKTVAWIGDGFNMCHSWMNAARQFDFQLKIACPKGFEPDTTLMHQNITLCASPDEAARHADLVTTDVWTSMGHEEEASKRMAAFAGFEVTEAVMQQSRPDAVFMHCLPAHRGEEVSTTVIDGAQSVVWDEAENRLHSQKALLEFLLS
jgi:ornithine carbamoyltransferase